MFTLRADDDPIGMHQIVDGTAFAQEFRITNNVKFRAVTIIAFNRFGYFFASFYRYRAFIDDDPVISENTGDLAPESFLNIARMLVMIWAAR